jgi:hypothetical protein
MPLTVVQIDSAKPGLRAVRQGKNEGKDQDIYVFPGPRDRNRPMSENAILRAN